MIFWIKMMPIKCSKLVHKSLRRLRISCSKRQFTRLHNKQALARLSITNFPALPFYNFQRRLNSSINCAKSGIITSSDTGESKEDNKKATINLDELIDKFEDAILRDLDKSDSKQNTTDEDIIDKFLSKPTWSTIDEYGHKENEDEQNKKFNESLGSSRPISISDEEIQRLLRLSALPPPNDPHQLQTLREDLTSQLAFVRKVQHVDTEGVEPLVCVRDETTEGLCDSTITLDDLQAALSKEYQIGKCQRPRKQETHIANEDTKWDVFANSENVVEMNGEKFFIVKKRESAFSSVIKEKGKT